MKSKEKATAALNHLALLRSGTKDMEPKKFLTFAIKSVRESGADDPEPGLYVEGILAGEEIDFEGEIMDYATSKPNFQAWNKKMSELSGGKSVGNLRGQHNSKIAAGKFVEMNYDDGAKSIPVVAKVVDPGEQEKVREGVYTSFSVGAHYARKWKDGKNVRWTADPFEGSLVDFGAIPMTRGFTYQAADGKIEERQFDGGRRELRKAFEAAGKPLSVEQEDQVVKTVNGLGAALKGLYTISAFARLMEDLMMLRDSLTFERDYEGDDSPVTDRVAEASEELLECLAAYAQEEVSEEIGKRNPVEEKTVDIKDLAKDLPVETKTAAVADPAAAATAAAGDPNAPDAAAVAKAIDGINDSLKILKAAGFKVEAGTLATKAGKQDDADEDDKSAAGDGKCTKTKDECTDEKCMTHKGKAAAAGAGDDVALKAGDVRTIVNDRLKEFSAEITESIEKTITKPLGEQLETIGKAIAAIAGSPMPARVAGAGARLVGKDAEANRDAEDAEKSIAADVKDGRTTSAIMKIRAGGGNRVTL